MYEEQTEVRGTHRYGWGIARDGEEKCTNVESTEEQDAVTNFVLGQRVAHDMKKKGFESGTRGR